MTLVDKYKAIKESGLFTYLLPLDYYKTSKNGNSGIHDMYSVVNK